MGVRASRKTRGEQKIKESFLVILRGKPLPDITMSEVAKVANVSRSTLYTHFPNTMDIFEACVRDFFSDVRSLDMQMKCRDCMEASAASGKQPFCLAIRDAGKYAALVKDPQFLPTMLELSDVPGFPAEDAPGRLDGLSPVQQSALRRFQLSGCYSAAMGTDKNIDYTDVMSAIDNFIQGGINAVRRSPEAPR